jgi:hypothetical protein
VAQVAKSFVYLPSTDKLLTPQISNPTARPSNTNGKTGSIVMVHREMEKPGSKNKVE